MKITIEFLQTMKAETEKICSLTAYDASFAAILEDAGIEVVLVGDSLGMVLHGKDSTLKVSMDDMVYHTKIVSSACLTSLVVADLPYRSYENREQALQNSLRLVNEAGADMVKLEGEEEVAEIVEYLCENNIEVCGHVGLQPQSVEKYGGYKVQGRDEKSAKDIFSGALALEKAGAKLIVLECIPMGVAGKVTAALNIPTIGIGAGFDCDGQVLVLYDVIGISGRVPKMAKNFLAESGNIRDAVLAYIDGVKTGGFPASEHSFE
jgi:3-methyl-2-oxobutanoate hydroxymethyltransferase